MGKPVSVLRVDCGAARVNRDLGAKPVVLEQENRLDHAALVVNDSGKACVGGADKRRPLFYGPKGGHRKVLALGGRGLGPRVVGNVYKDFRSGMEHRAANVWKGVLKANRKGRADFGAFFLVRAF